MAIRKESKKGVIRFAKLRTTEPVSTPSASYPGDAGFDLTVSRPLMVAPGCFGQVPVNISIEIPHGYYGLLLPRSSTFYKRSLIVNPGVIDGGYRGEIVGLVYNLGDNNAMLYAGERIFQLLVMENVSTRFKWEMVAQEGLGTSDRGEKGFGSTDER
jgi:dUTP pyrophosphatase